MAIEARSPIGGGRMGELVRHFEWSSTALGAIQAWPDALHVAVQLALDSPLPTLVAWGPDLTCIHNDAYRPLLGGEAEALGLPLREVSSEAIDTIRPFVEQALAGDASARMAVRSTVLRHGASEQAWFDHGFSPLRDREGIVRGVLGQAVETAATVERRPTATGSAAGLSSDFRALFEAAPTPLLVVAPPDWTIVAVNDARVEVTGRTRDEVIGRRLFDVFPNDPGDPDADGVEMLSGSLERVVSSRAEDVMAVQRYPIMNHDGRYEERCWTSINTPVLDKDGEVALVIHRVEDVTDLVRMRGRAEAADTLAREQQTLIDRLRDTETALTASETRYRRIVEGAGEFAIITLDAGGTITGWNSGAEQILGWSAAQAIGQSGDLFFTPEDRLQGAPDAERARAAAVGRAPDERWHLRRDDKRFWGSGVMIPLDDDSGGFLKIFRDRTGDHAHEQRLELLARASAGILAADDPISVLDDIMRDGARVLGVDQSHSYAITPDGRNLRLVHSIGVDRSGGNAASDVAVDGPLCGVVAESRAALIVANLQSSTEPRYDLARAAGIQAYAGFPIVSREELFGVVSFTSLSAQQFDAEALSFFATLAQFLSLAREREQRELALRASEARYRTLFEAIDSGFCIIQLRFDADDKPVDYRFLEVNPAFEQQTGLSDAVGRWMRDLVPALEQHWFDLYGRVARTGEPVRFENPAAAMGDRWYDVHAFRTGAPEDGRVAILFNDISGRRRAEEALQRLNETLEDEVAERTAERDRMWETSPDLMVVIDFAGVFRRVNPAWTTTLGYETHELVGRHVNEFVLPDDHSETVDAYELAARGASLRIVNRYRHKDGAARWISWVAAPAGDMTYATGRDITAEMEQADALRHTEEQLRQAQKMEAVGQLTGGLAHDFNNLLTGMMGNLELLQHRVARGRLEELDRFILAAQGAGRRAASLTQRLLAFSRRQTLDPRPTDLNRLIAGMEDMLRRTIGPANTLEVVGAGGLWVTNIDAGQLENALLNSCINARDAMPDGGRLTVETANKWLDEHAARERDLPAGQYVTISVTDTGTGMDQRTIERAFEPFFTTKPIGQGTGLGLSMIYGFARQSGGQVRIYSELGMGTTLCIYLPRHVGEADVDTAAPAASAVSTGSGTILIVDDEATIRHLVDEVLDEVGYTVIGAGDGAAGVKVLQSGARIDLLITDVGLPNGMNGRQVADVARSLRPGLKVLFITGYAENAAVGNGHLELGMELLTKPFSLDALLGKVNDMMKSA